MSETYSHLLPGVSSAFQPILSVAHQAPVGYEALLRSTNGRVCSPAEALRRAALIQRSGEFERECVQSHAAQFARFAEDESVLFVNVQPEVLTHPVHGPGLISDILSFGMLPARVAMETVGDSAATQSNAC